MRPTMSFKMRFSLVLFLQFVLEIGLTIISSEDAEKTTLSPYSVIEYRVPLKHPLLSEVADPDAELSSYFAKLKIDYPKDNLDPVLKSPRHMEWSDRFTVYRLYVRNMYACELKKTRIGNMKFEYHDEMTDVGMSACFNQCMSENDQYFTLFLSGKLQDLIYKDRSLDVALNAPKYHTKPEEMFECTRLAKKKYRCNCFYKNFRIKLGPDFGDLFDKIVRETRDATAANVDPKQLEEKYRVPIKLVGFLILYHLKPDHMFNYLLWWTNEEIPFLDD